MLYKVCDGSRLSANGNPAKREYYYHRSAANANWSLFESLSVVSWSLFSKDKKVKGGSNNLSHKNLPRGYHYDIGVFVHNLPQ